MLKLETCSTCLAPHDKRECFLRPTIEVKVGLHCEAAADEAFNKILGGDCFEIRNGDFSSPLEHSERKKVIPLWLSKNNV